MAIPSGEIYLLKNIPLNPSYEHTIDFKDRNEQFQYFYSFRAYAFTNYTYVRREREYISVELPLERLDDVNYLIFRSKEGDRLYYAFIVDKMYVNPTTSTIFYKLDVMQTYMFDYKFRETYVRQAHVDRWTADKKPIYSKTDEQLDYGTEYAVESAFRIEQSTKIQWLLVSLVGATAIQNNDTDTGIFETVNTGTGLDNSEIRPVTSSFVNVLLPMVKEDSAKNFSADYEIILTNAMISGGDVTQNTRICDYNKFVNGMLKSATGNYIKSISLLPYNPLFENETVDEAARRITVSLRQYGAKNSDFYICKFKNVDLPAVGIFNAFEDIFRGDLARMDWDNGIENSIPTAEQWQEIKSKPLTTKRDKRFESKLLCAPYRYNLLSDWRNGPVVFKNEYLTTDKLLVKYSCAFSYNAPFRYYIDGYKRDPEGRNTCLSQPVAMDFPIISDQYYTYMLENKNTIQNNITNAYINMTAGAFKGAAGGAMMGGPMGALIGAVGGVATGALNIAQTIRNENAKQSDIKMKPDNIINSNDSAFNVYDKNVSINFYRMRICCENEEIIAEIFNLTGYKVNRIEIPNTRSRMRFNYIQTAGANIVGSFNQNALMEIKSIYDKGVTIWHYSEKDFNFLDYSFENLERNLL